MSQDFDPLANGTQNNTLFPTEMPSKSSWEATIASRETATEITAPTTIPETSKAAAYSSLKLVTSAAVSEPIYKSAPSPKHYFTAEVRKRSPYDFIMVARDSFHSLHCELPLTLEENQEGKKKAPSLVCQFPMICDDALIDFIDGDEDLLGMTLISLHMQILKNLFLFCGAQKAQKIILQATEDQYKGLGIYQDFIKYVDKVPTNKGMAMEITIPVHSKSVEQCDELIDNITEQFRQTLWHDQNSNPAIRDYLKANVRLSIIT